VNQSTHAIVLFGIFVCEECADKIVEHFGFINTYPKKVMEEHWDDFQLMAIAKGCGGNKLMYTFLQEYQLESKPYTEKYSSRAFLWY
jgi:hypothetical protein